MEINLYSGKLSVEQVDNLNPNLIISYNYKYIIENDVIESVRGNIINLHISYLPWNKGSSPNFWSFIDNTPKGVTIHKVDAHLDTGGILYQKEILFNENIETFNSTYNKLNDEIVNLLCEKFDDIISNKYLIKKQAKAGTYHNSKDFEQFTKEHPVDWNENISEYKKLICINK